MMKSLFVLLITVLVVACVPRGPVTYPEGSTLCNKDPDCLEGQYCGFVPGYSAAVCRGPARSNKPNLR